MTSISLETTVASIPLSTCIYNASGPRTGSGQALSKIASSSAGAVLAKSATLVEQSGNPLPRTWHHENNTNNNNNNNNNNNQGEESHASMNSEGLPNYGIDYYICSETIDEAVGACAGDGATTTTTTKSKPYFVSISGKNLNDNIEMLNRIHSKIKNGETRISGVELNLACPNIIGKPIIAYDFEQMESVLESISQLPIFALDKIPLGVKMAPYFDGPHYARAANILNKYSHVVKYVASINTIGNSFMVDPIAEMPVIRSNGGFAGLSGRAVKYTALANVKKMRELLVEEIDVVGVGGVFTGQDAFDMILCGATAVQVGTCHWTEGPKCFDRICQELQDIMQSKGYKTIDDFKNKLKEWSKEGVAQSRQVKLQKKQQQQSGTASTGTIDVASTTTGHNPTDVMVMAGLVLIIAMLLADKWNVISIG